MAETTLSSIDAASFTRLPGNRRVLLIGVLVVVLAALAAVGRWASTPTYVTLYRDLDLKESGLIAEQLGKTNVPYKLVTGGTEVQVPVAEVARARVALAKDGLPASGRPGLELFDKPSWGMTDFTQRVTYQRALEGELSRTLGQIAGVERAEVHLVMPAPSAVRRNDRPAGASVVLTLRGGASLGPESVQGMAYIVSNSVESLSPDNVAIMDATGRVLSAPASAGTGSGLTGRQLEVQRGIEQRTVDKIEEMVATVVGVGRVRAQVTAEMSFDQVDQTVETFNPDGQVLQTEQRSEGSAEGGGQQTVVSNQYQNSRRMERSQSNAGKLTRITVAVLVDEKSLRAERTRQLADLDAMVRNAVGIDSTRGDRLSVLAVPFEPVAVEQAQANAKPKVDVVATAERFSRPAVGIVAIVAMILVALQLVRALGPSKSARGGGGAPGGAPTAGTLPAGADAEVEPPALPTPDEARVLKLKERLRHESQHRPETTAQVMRAWLAEKP